MFWCENLEFGVEKSVFLVSAENGAGVNKMTNITYGYNQLDAISWENVMDRNGCFGDR